ncbi:MAG: helix-turn-helix domain-containing protein [Spirochaetaceae bacterium]|jgi:transcriptional regulator with XRE-family HTH domain|nr:helix-turn-helix domain-containing protein [Spirochaetaceae bacterium]
MAFKDNLRSELMYQDISVKELAYRSGIKQKTIESYLGPRAYTPSVEAAYKIASSLQVSMEFLVTGNDEKEDRLISTYPKDTQEIVRLLERLGKKERKAIFLLARTLLEN